MGRRRKKGAQAQAQQSNAAATTFGQAKAKKGLIDSIGGLLTGASSYKGAFWFGVGLAVVCFAKNAAFYIGLGMALGAAPIVAGLAGIGFALGSTYCEVYNLSQGTSGMLALRRTFQIASRPEKLPTITSAQYHDPNEPGDRYRATIDGMENLMVPLGWGCFGIEVMVGIIFLLGAEPGIAALMELGGFIFSIVGTVGGVLLALKSYDLHLPPAAHEQMKEIITANRRLKI